MPMKTGGHRMDEFDMPKGGQDLFYQSQTHPPTSSYRVAFSIMLLVFLSCLGRSLVARLAKLKKSSEIIREQRCQLLKEEIAKLNPVKDFVQVSLREREIKRLEREIEELKTKRKESSLLAHFADDGTLSSLQKLDMFKVTLLIYAFVVYYFWNVPIAVIPRTMIRPADKLLSFLLVQTDSNTNDVVVLGVLGWLLICFFALSDLSRGVASLVVKYIGKQRVISSGQMAEQIHAQGGDKRGGSQPQETAETKETSREGSTIRARGNKSKRFQTKTDDD